jgi:two-component system, NarL family, response regulator DevR
MFVVDAPLSVFLLAQNRLLRESLGRILSKKSDIAIVGACPFSLTTPEEIVAANPDVLVMDSFSTASHLQFTRDLQASLPDVRILMIGMEEEEQPFLQAVRGGASGYILKDASALEIVAAVRAVGEGEAVCPPDLCLSLFRYVSRQSQRLPSFHMRVALGLTSREQQLMSLIGQGLTNKEIAFRLQLAEQTVRNHVHRMLKKVGADNRLAAVEVCRMQGLAV